MRRIHPIVLGTILGVTASAGAVDVMWRTIDGGAGKASGGTITVRGSIGQPDAGTLAAGAVTVRAGFWPGPATCYPDCDGDLSLTLADFGCFQTKFALADPYADCNGDTLLNLADFGCFQTAFALGCP